MPNRTASRILFSDEFIGFVRENGWAIGLALTGVSVFVIFVGCMKLNFYRYLKRLTASTDTEITRSTLTTNNPYIDIGEDETGGEPTYSYYYYFSAKNGELFGDRVSTDRETHEAIRRGEYEPSLILYLIDRPHVHWQILANDTKQDVLDRETVGARHTTYTWLISGAITLAVGISALVFVWSA